MSEQPNLDWFEVREFPADVYGIGEPGHFEDVKSYLVVGSDLAMLVDTGMGIANIRDVVEQITDRPVLVVNSHGHLDHIGDNWRFHRRWSHPLEVDAIEAGVGNDRMRQYLAPESFNRPPPEMLDTRSFHIPGTTVERTIDEGDVVDLGSRRFHVLHTPGHSSGGLSLFEPETGILIAGDAVYEGPLFAHHDGGSAAEYRATLQRLQALAPELSVVYPSHNRYPLDPSFITEIHLAMEEICTGMTPQRSDDDTERFDFGAFSFTFQRTWSDEFTD